MNDLLTFLAFPISIVIVIIALIIIYRVQYRYKCYFCNCRVSNYHKVYDKNFVYKDFYCCETCKFAVNSFIVDDVDKRIVYEFEKEKEKEKEEKESS